MGVMAEPGTDGQIAVLDIHLALYRALLDGCALASIHPYRRRLLDFVLKFDAAQIMRGTQMMLTCVTYPHRGVGASSDTAHKTIGVARGKDEQLRHVLGANPEGLAALTQRKVLPIP
jgi:hypothetical protein